MRWSSFLAGLLACNRLSAPPGGPVEVVAFTAYDPALDEGDAVGQAALEVVTVIAE